MFNNSIYNSYYNFMNTFILIAIVFTLYFTFRKDVIDKVREATVDTHPAVKYIVYILMLLIVFTVFLGAMTIISVVGNYFAPDVISKPF